MCLDLRGQLVLTVLSHVLGGQFGWMVVGGREGRRYGCSYRRSRSSPDHQLPDQPRRGEVTRFCREHGISRAEFYKVRSRAKTEGKLAAVTPKQPVAKSVKRHTSQELEAYALQVRADLKRPAGTTARCR